MFMETISPLMNESFFYQLDEDGTGKLKTFSVNGNFYQSRSIPVQPEDQKKIACRTLHVHSVEELEAILKRMMHDPSVARTAEGYYTDAPPTMEARALWTRDHVGPTVVVDDECELKTIAGVESLVVDTRAKRVHCKVVQAAQKGGGPLTMADVHHVFARGIESLSTTFDLHSESMHTLSAVRFEPRLEREGDADDATVMPRAIATTLFSCDRLLKGMLSNIDLSDESPFDSMPFDSTGMRRLPQDMRDVILELRARCASNDSRHTTLFHFEIGETEAAVRELPDGGGGVYEFKPATVCLVLRVIDAEKNCEVDSSAMQAMLPRLAYYFPELARLEALARLVCIQHTVGELARATDPGPPNASALSLAARLSDKMTSEYKRLSPTRGGGGEGGGGGGGGDSSWIKDWIIEHVVARPGPNGKRPSAQEVRVVRDNTKRVLMAIDAELPTLLRNTLALGGDALEDAHQACRQQLNAIMASSASSVKTLETFAARLADALRKSPSGVAMQLRTLYVRQQQHRRRPRMPLKQIEEHSVLEVYYDGAPCFSGTLVSRHPGYLIIGNLRTNASSSSSATSESMITVRIDDDVHVPHALGRQPLVGERVAVRNVFDPKIWVLATVVATRTDAQHTLSDVRYDNGVVEQNVYHHEMVVWDADKNLPVIEEGSRVLRTPDAYLPSVIILDEKKNRFRMGGVCIVPRIKCTLQAEENVFNYNAFPTPSSSSYSCPLMNPSGNLLCSFPPQLSSHRQSDGGAFWGWKIKEGGRMCDECVQFKEKVERAVGTQPADRQYQLDSVFMYTDKAYVQINSLLMQGKVPGGIFKPLNDFVRDPQNRACPPGMDSCIVYRKSNVFNPEQENYIAGTRVMIKNFTSTSLDPQAIEIFKPDAAYTMKIEVRADSEYAAYLGEHSKYSVEQEVLFRPTTVFEVIAIDHTERTIKLREATTTTSASDSLVISQLCN